MYWFTRPSYGRWAAAAFIVLFALYLDLTGPPTTDYPFTGADASVGAPVTIEWRRVPSDVLPPAADISGVATVPLAAGTPLVAGLLRSDPIFPDDWWALTLDLPTAARPGEEALITFPGLEVPGLVVSASAETTFGGTWSGVVAVPPEHAAAVAAAVATGAVTVLVRP